MMTVWFVRGQRRLLLLALLLPGALGVLGQARVGIGTAVPTQTLDVNGTLRIRGLNGSGTRLPTLQPDGTLGVSAPVYSTAGTLPEGPSLVSSIAQGSGARGLAVSGNIAYVLNQGSNTLQLVKVDNPASPALLGSVGTGSAPIAVAVRGTTAYVVNSFGNTLQLFNVADPLNPALLSTVSTGSSPRSVAVSGTTAYVVNGFGHSLSAFNVTNPANPVLLSTISTGTTPISVAASGTTVYVVSQNGNTLQLFNMANPVSPVLLSTTPAGSSLQSVAVSGTTAYVISGGDNTLRVFDVATPGAPVLLSSVGTDLAPVSVAVSGTTAYVVNLFSGSVQSFDVSTPSAPVLLHTLPTESTPRTVAVSGTTAYVTSSNRLEIFDFPAQLRTVVVNPDGSLVSVASPTLSRTGATLRIAGGNSVTLPTSHLADVSPNAAVGTLAAGGSATVTFAVPGATTSATATLSPRAALGNGIVVAQVWVSGTDVVSMRLTNAGNNSVSVTATTYNITVVQ